MTNEEIIDILSSFYSSYKIYGPYIDKDSRKRLTFRKLNEFGKIIKNKPDSSFTMQWARAKMIVKLNSILTDEEEVDHIDDNLSNDDYDNLQILTKSEHRMKSGIENSLRCNKRQILRCPNCFRDFECRPYRLRRAKEKCRFPCCSRSCSSTFYFENQHT